MAFIFNGHNVNKVKYNGKYISKINYNEREITFGYYNDTALQSFNNKPIIKSNITNVEAVMNLHNGNVKICIPDAIFGQSALGIGVGHIYNAMMNNDAIYDAKWTFMGKGFKINYQQYLMYNEVNGVCYYIDSEGTKHKFEKAKNGETYYDTSGSGKLMIISENLLTLTDRENNKLTFDRKTGFLKKIENNLGHLTEIFYNDTLISSIVKTIGNEKRTMGFNYDNLDRLSTITYAGATRQIIYKYKDNTNLLESIKKQTLEHEELVVEMQYDSARQLTQIKNNANQTIKFYYNNSKVTKVQEGRTIGNSFKLLSKRNITYNAGNTEVAMTTEENIDNVIDTVNQIRMVYQYNYNGILLSTYERHGNNYTSVFPAPNIGTRLMRRVDNTDQPSFNGVLINKFEKDTEDEEQNFHQKSDGKGGDNSNNIGAMVNMINGTSEFARTYTFSFWYQITEGPTTPLKLKIKFDTNNFIEKEFNIVDNNWHFVSFEKYFKKNEEISKIEMFLVAKKDEGFLAKITDIRAIQNAANTKIKDGNNEVDIRKINKIVCDQTTFLIKDARDIINDNQYFITARDILWNEHEKQKNSGNFYLNNGEKLIFVDYSKNLKFYAGSVAYTFKTGDYVAPFLFNEVIKDKNTTIKSHSYPSGDNIHYEEITRGYKGKIQTRVFKKYDKCMRIIDEMDEYDVHTRYEYDTFGNLKSTLIKPLNSNESTLKIYQEYKYDINGNLEQKIEANNILTNYIADGIHGNVKSIIDANEKLKKEFTYHKANDKVSTIKYLIGPGYATEYKTGTLNYNDKGFLESFVRSDNQVYNFTYDDCGNLDSYKINNQLIQEKDTWYHSRGVAYMSKYANEADWQKSFYDIYGRLDVKREGDIDKYNNVFEDKAGFRSSGALLKRATDHYSGTTFTFDYDINDSLYQYSYAGQGISGSVKMSDTSDDPSDICYTYKQSHDLTLDGKKFNANYSRDVIISYDSSKIINPRIVEESDSSSGVKYKYIYDQLGRIERLNLQDKMEGGPEFTYREVNTALGCTTTYDIKTISMKYTIIINPEPGTSIPAYPLNVERLYELEYDNNHNITKCTKTDYNVIAVYNYRYDELNRLRREQINENGFTRVKVYEYDEYGNRRKTTTEYFNEELVPEEINSGETETYQYDSNFKDRLKSIYNSADSSKNCYFDYDSIGNPIKYKVRATTANNNMIWARGNLLSTYLVSDESTVNYKYDINGVRVEKEHIYGNQEKSCISKYHLDGAKILGETKIIKGDFVTIHEHVPPERYSVMSLQYEYNHTGITGVIIDGKTYMYEKDAMGSIVKIYRLYDSNNRMLVAEYRYDAWGNGVAKWIHEDERCLEYNPFLWKGHYYDSETELYYINGNYYDPKTGRYINCNDLADITTNNDKLMESTYCLENCNPVMFANNMDTNEPYLKLNIEFKYVKKSIWQLIFMILGTIMTILSIILTILAPPLGVAGYIVSGLLIAASVAMLCFQLADLMEYFTNVNIIRRGLNMSKSLYNKIKIGLAITIIVLSVVSAFLPRAHCFKEGTMVHTESGSEKIEDIKVGDKVWAWDEKTKTKALKKVVRLFRNTTKQWTLVEIDGENGTETITCTPGHKFFLPENKNRRNLNEVHEHEGYELLSEQWVSAQHLKKGDKVLLENGKYGIIKGVTLQELDTPETTYNFEVAISPSLLSGGKLEKITAKKENTFNVEGKGLVEPKDVKVGDKIILETGEIATVKSAEEKITGGPEATYNLEVEDFHTYYVGSAGVLVHNMCGGADDAFDVMQFDDAAIAEARQPIVNSKGVARDPSFSTFKRKLFAAQERLHPGTFAEGTTNIINGQKVILHHPLGRAGANLYNVVGVTQSQHLAIHAITGYRNAIWSAVNYNLGSGVF